MKSKLLRYINTFALTCLFAFPLYTFFGAMDDYGWAEEELKRVEDDNYNYVTPKIVGHERNTIWSRPWSYVNPPITVVVYLEDDGDDTYFKPCADDIYIVRVSETWNPDYHNYGAVVGRTNRYLFDTQRELYTEVPKSYCEGKDNNIILADLEWLETGPGSAAAVTLELIKNGTGSS